MPFINALSQFSQVFMTSHMDAWLNFVSKEKPASSHTYKEICDLGVELLFNADSFKQIAEAPSTSALFDVLRTHISPSSPHLLSTLPFLMAAFTKKRRSLPPSGGSSVTDANSLAMSFFSSCEELLHGVGDLHESQVWHSRLGLLKVVEDESVFSSRNEKTAVILKKEVTACIECSASVYGMFLW